MHTTITSSAEQSDFLRYTLAGQCLADYFKVSSNAEFEAKFIECKADIVHLGRKHFVTSNSSLGNVAWITKHGQVQKKTVFVLNLGNVALTLKFSLPISLEVSATNVVAYSYDLDELAVSQSESEVLDEMRATIAETYFLLKLEQEVLGPIQRRHWEFLKHIISEV